jgi:hypothetical protein
MDEVDPSASLKRCGVSDALILRLGNDEAYARLIANFMGLADRHPVIWVATTGDGRVKCVHCGEALVPMCACCEQNLRIL